MWWIFAYSRQNDEIAERNADHDTKLRCDKINRMYTISLSESKEFDIKRNKLKNLDEVSEILGFRADGWQAYEWYCAGKGKLPNNKYDNVFFHRGAQGFATSGKTKEEYYEGIHRYNIALDERMQKNGFPGRLFAYEYLRGWNYKLGREMDEWRKNARPVKAIKDPYNARYVWDYATNDYKRFQEGYY